jgi:hypothetical protein
MKKLLTISLIFLFLSACSTTKKDSAEVSSEFLGGGIKVTYSKSGKF